MRLPPLGLYLHLPWCQRKCPYCDFNSHEGSDVPEQRYIDATLRDLHNDLPLAGDREVETVFIGGGTPSLFSAAGIETLLDGIANLLALAPDAEITMEANPGSAEAGKFRALREAGINRLSLGIQSFDDAHLQALGRVHDSEEAFAAIESAQRAGFDSLNLDLMHGLPGQTVESAENDLRSAIAAGPQHLSWYQLTIEPNTVFHKRPPVLPGENMLSDIQEHGERLLSENGYRQYEVSAYCREGFQCRHNRNYWTFGDYLGIGAGAHGKVTFPDGRIGRYARRRQPDEYMSAAVNDFLASSRTLDTADTIGEFMMNALRLNEGFTLAQFTSRTGLDGSVLENPLDRLYSRDLLALEDGVIATTALGRRFLNTVVGEFF
jgi:oxygen-independent coproporphyrinogen-3 oxidase